MKAWLSLGVVLLALSRVGTAPAAAGAVIREEEPDEGEASSSLPKATESLTARELTKAVGDELAKRRLLLAMHQLRMHFSRDASGEWFLRIEHSVSGCSATEAQGNFAALSTERVQALASSVASLVERSHCGNLSPEASPLASPPARGTEPWVRPAAGVWASASLVAMGAFWATNDPLLPRDSTKPASVALYSALALGLLGGTATLLVPERAERPTLELTVASSMALQSLAFAWAPEHGLPVWGEYAAAAGYGLSAALVGIDWVMTSRHSGTVDRPQALSPWSIYGPATLGALVSLSRVFSPHLGGEDREIAAALGAYELAPAATGLILGVVRATREAERHPYEPWLASGPRGSLGLTLGGSF